MSSLKEDLIEYATEDAPPLMWLDTVTTHYEDGPSGEYVVVGVERTFTAAPGGIATIEEAEAEGLARAQAKVEAEGIAAVVSAPSSKSKGGRL